MKSESISDVIRESRISRGLSIMDMAVLLGIGRNAYSRKERDGGFTDVEIFKCFERLGLELVSMPTGVLTRLGATVVKRKLPVAVVKSGWRDGVAGRKK